MSHFCVITARRNRNAFSLVELVVVIAIIGILMSFLLPALQGARRRATVVACANNMRQIAIALHMYLIDSHDVDLLPKS
jgi:prepilin-type N-terminal cleavage/methylation domain-containing protein